MLHNAKLVAPRADLVDPRREVDIGYPRGTRHDTLGRSLLGGLGVPRALYINSRGLELFGPDRRREVCAGEGVDGSGTLQLLALEVCRGDLRLGVEADALLYEAIKALG